MSVGDSEPGREVHMTHAALAAGEPVDVLLSSGFLAFARHSGVVAALEAAGVTPGAVVGTSSGALVGALWAAGHDAATIARELGSRGAPLRSMRLSLTPWRGVFDLRALVALGRELLPPRIEDLPRPFFAGVAHPDGGYRLLGRGPLPEAVAASCAIPYIFRPVTHGGVAYRDGGVVDRLGLDAWRQVRGSGRPAVVHLVERTGGREVPYALDGLVTVRTPRSGASFFSLGDFHGQLSEARRLAEAALIG